MILFTGYDATYKDIGIVSSKLIKDYCARYSLKSKVYADADYGRFPSWNKLKYFLDCFGLIEENELALWIDADAFILNFDVDIQKELSVIDKDIIISKDINNINCGCFALRKNNYTIELLKYWWNMEHHIESGWWEQSALMEILEMNTLDINNHIHYANQRLFNSYLYDLYQEIFPDEDFNFPQGQYHKGDFILHLPALTNDKRMEIIQPMIPVL